MGAAPDRSGVHRVRRAMGGAAERRSALIRTQKCNRCGVLCRVSRMLPFDNVCAWKPNPAARRCLYPWRNTPLTIAEAFLTSSLEKC
jgi:hypothetical protein